MYSLREADDRPSDYDTAGDPVVRVTVAEIRKRIAQYYHDESHANELRIELLVGRYAPEFRVSREVRQPFSDGVAIIARVHAEDTGEPEVIVAGIGMSGTAAAGELLTSPMQMEALRQRVGKAFDHADFEAVIRTDVANGIAGPPKILTVTSQ